MICATISRTCSAAIVVMVVVLDACEYILTFNPLSRPGSHSTRVTMDVLEMGDSAQHDPRQQCVWVRSTQWFDERIPLMICSKKRTKVKESNSCKGSVGALYASKPMLTWTASMPEVILVREGTLTRYK